MKNKRNFENLVALPITDGYVMVLLSDIVHCKAEGNRTHVYLVNGKEAILSRRLDKMEKVLPKKQFFRVHDQHLVNFKHIEMWVKKDRDYLCLSDGSKAPIAEVRKKGLKAWLGVQG